jgi:hypothetical protein
MKRQFRLIVTVIVAAVSLGVGVGEAGVIFPINVSGANAGTPNLNSPVTASLFDSNGQDVTDTWLPTWEPPGPDGPTIYVSFNAPGALPTVQLVTFNGTPVFTGAVNPFWVSPFGSPTTSAYPGRCTNFDGTNPTPAATDPDYTFSTNGVQITTSAGTQRTAFALTSQDCGGMAVIQATFPSGTAASGTYLFVIPQDSNHNGIPDIWEAKFCPNNACVDPKADVDAGPLSPSQTGDGIAAFDEYRGFIVSGAHVSTDPRQRDLFVHLVNPQCGAPSLLGGGTPTYPTDGSSLFANLASLVPASQIHLLGYVRGGTNTTTTEWVDRFESFSQQTGFQYRDPITNAVTGIAPVDDRRINKNAVFPQGIANPITANGLIHKGLRVTECLDVSSTSGPLGTTGIGTPDGPDNSLVYTQRIFNYITQLIANGQGRPRRVFTFQNGSWVQKTSDGTPNGPTPDDFIISEAMKFYIAHELTHSMQLTPTVEGTRQTSYGYHHAPGTGSVMDQTITQKIDKTGGFNSFYIPSVYNGADQSSYKAE